MTDSYLLLGDYDDGANLKTKYWKGEYQTYGKVIKLNKLFKSEKTKWIVLSKLGNIYIFNRHDAVTHKSVFNIFNTTTTFDSTSVKFKNKYIKIEVKLDDVNTFKDKFYQVLSFRLKEPRE